MAIEEISVATALTTFSRPYQPVFRAIVLVFDMKNLAPIASESARGSLRFDHPAATGDN
jgi:hypothetical protein